MKILTVWNKGRNKMIKENMRFVNFCDFYDRRFFIRKLYLNLSSDNKQLYKYYVYSRRVLKDKVCDIIWEYLNVMDDEGFINQGELLDKERSKYL